MRTAVIATTPVPQPTSKTFPPGPNVREFRQVRRRWCRERFERREMLPALPLRLLEFGDCFFAHAPTN
jgi:hypothetical protein